MSVRNFIFKHSYLDLDYIYGTLSVTGEVKYFDKTDMKQDDYNILKASSAIPFVCHPYKVDGTPYYDRALGDPVLVERAFQMGCDMMPRASRHG